MRQSSQPTLTINSILEHIMPFDLMSIARITNVIFLDLKTSPYGICDLERIMICD